MHDDVVICRCEEVRLSQVLRAIEQGARTSMEVKARTRVGMGICQGRTCRPLVTEIVGTVAKLPNGEATPLSFRPPVRPVLLKELVASGHGPEALDAVLGQGVPGRTR